MRSAKLSTSCTTQTVRAFGNHWMQTSTAIGCRTSTVKLVSLKNTNSSWAVITAMLMVLLIDTMRFKTSTPSRRQLSSSSQAVKELAYTTRTTTMSKAPTPTDAMLIQRTALVAMASVLAIPASLPSA